MEADPTYIHKEFGSVEQGDLVIAVLKQAGGVQRAVYGMKSSRIVNGREEVDYFVALDNEKPPAAYHHQALRSRALLPNQTFRGYPQPGTLGGFRPDVVAKKGKERKIIEVETTESVNSARDVQQQKAFRQAARRSKNTTFRRVVVKTEDK